MAYIIWKVFMKKYSRIRLGLHGSPVTPSGRHVLTYEEESWKPSPEEQSSSKEFPVDCRTSDIRQSKTKRVKNYLKKCKSVLGKSGNPDSVSGSPAWYVDDEVISGRIQEGEVLEIEDVFEKVQVLPNLDCDLSSICEVANVVDVGRKPENIKIEGEDGDANEHDGSSVLLTTEQENIAGAEAVNTEAGLKEEVQVKSDVASLVDRYFGHLYANYDLSRGCLVRQARDLLVCEYHGSLGRFESEFCLPAGRLLQRLKDDFSTNPCTPSGWPLCLGPAGIIIHLSPLETSLVRNGDCYICIRHRSAPGLELALTWRTSSKISCRTLAEFADPICNGDVVMCSTIESTMDLERIETLSDYDDLELPEMLQNLLVSVERAVERVPLDELLFPCPQCLKYVPMEKTEDDGQSCSCQCTCRVDGKVAKKDTSIQTSPMFEFVGSIPHIDSDEEDDKDSVKSGMSNKKFFEISRPSKITDLPEKLLMSGINLPGTTDLDGRPILLCYAECIARAGLNKYEIARLFLYYSSVTSPESAAKGFTLLLLAENGSHVKVLETIDKALCILSTFVRVNRVIVWRPGESQGSQKPLLSKIQVVVVTEEASLASYISKDQAPASCGGSCSHDQLEWVEFFKQFEPFVESCQNVGRSLLSTLAQLRHEDVPTQVTRRFLNHQCRQLTKALQLDCVQKLKRMGKATLTSLEERLQWVTSSKDASRASAVARESFSAVDRITLRLEQLVAERKERLKELARLRTLQDEADELFTWVQNAGEESLNRFLSLIRTSADTESIKATEKEFESFYFNSLRQIDKSNDLIEEAANIKNSKGQSLKDSLKTLKVQMKAFTDNLEEARESLESASRCFCLLDSCQDILVDDNKEREDFKKLAHKSGNDKLIQICKGASKDNISLPLLPTRDRPCTPKTLPISEAPVTSTPIKSHGSQIRRRSVSSLAYIYHCNHHAAGESCNCCESDTENSVSYKLKKKYIQTLQTCGCKETRGTSAGLDGIKEVRESVENLLAKSDNECSPCDSGISTADNSVGDDSVYKKKLQRICSCQYYSESCGLCGTGSSSSAGSNQDHTENQQDSVIEEGSEGFAKSGSDDIDEEHYPEERRKVPPITANSHLYCHSSNLHIPSEGFYPNIDPKTQKTLLLIMREMIQTERDYVKSLDYVIENYIPELMREDIPQALRGQRNVVFGNVEKIYEFHSQHFLRELEQCENNPLQVGQIFLKYDSKFYLYALYNKNKPKSDSLMSEYGTSFFRSKQIELGDKMDLASYLLKPVQRMGKYALLLQQMMKAYPALPPTASERAIAEQDDLKLAEEMVRFQLRHGNDLLAMDSIRECDVNLKEQGRLLRQNEFLVWEGRSGKKSLRQVFLFEELILFSKARRFPDRKNLDLYIYKNSIKMTDIGLTAKIGDSTTKFEIWFRKRKPNDTFTLQTMSEDVKKAWTEELSQLLWKQAIRNREVRMAEMSSMGIGNKPCLDIRPSADQINDRSISFAQLNKNSTPTVSSTSQNTMRRIYKKYLSLALDDTLTNSVTNGSSTNIGANKFRNSLSGPASDICRSSTKRPHSVISMSSLSSGSTSSGGSGGNTPSTPAVDSSGDSQKSFNKSGTLHSQCSLESGIIADMSLGSDECSELMPSGSHWPLEKSNSQRSTSTKSSASTPTQSDDTQVTSYQVPADVTINV